MTSYLSFGSGPSLILGHGMAQNKKSWIETGWVDRLSSVRTVHVFDFEGHGSNEGKIDSRKLTVPEMTKNIDYLIENLGINDFDYMGFSMGARAGFELASKNKKINKLISLGMHPGSPNLEERRFKKKSLAMKKLGDKTGKENYFTYSKIFKEALSWEGAYKKIKWKKENHLIVMGEKDDNFDLTEKLMNQNYKDNFLVLIGVNHKNTFDEPEHSIDGLINFLQS